MTIKNLELGDTITGITHNHSTNFSRIGTRVLTVRTGSGKEDFAKNRQGINSPLLGVSVSNPQCKLCKNTDPLKCGGHTALISTPFYISPVFEKHAMILANLVCGTCNKLHIQEKQMLSLASKYDLTNKINIPKYILELKGLMKAAGESCTGCGLQFPKYGSHITKCTINNITLSSILTPTQLKVLFFLLLDCEQLHKIIGKTNFLVFLHSVFSVNIPILSPTDRNYAPSNHQQTSQTQATFLYNELFRVINQLTKDEHNPNLIEKFFEVMGRIFGHGSEPVSKQYTQKQQYGNDTLLLKYNSKGGKYRQELLKDRPKKTGREYVTTTSIIMLDACVLQENKISSVFIEQTINLYNKDYFTKLFLHKPHEYPRINTVTRPTPETDSKRVYSLSEFISENLSLQCNDIVSRNLIDGDYILVNRPPSLLPSNLYAARLLVSRKDDSNSAGIKIHPTTIANLLKGDADGDALITHYPPPDLITGDILRLMTLDTLAKSIKDNKCELVWTNNALLAIYIYFHKPRKMTASTLKRILLLNRDLGLTMEDINTFCDKKYMVSDMIAHMLGPNFYINIIDDTTSESKFCINKGKFIGGKLTVNLLGGKSPGIPDSIHSCSETPKEAREIIERIGQTIEIYLGTTGITYAPHMLTHSDFYRDQLNHLTAVKLIDTQITYDTLNNIPHRETDNILPLATRISTVVSLPDDLGDYVISTLPGGEDNTIMRMLVALKGSHHILRNSLFSNGLVYAMTIAENINRNRRSCPYAPLNSNDIMDLGMKLHPYSQTATMIEVVNSKPAGFASMISRRLESRIPGAIARPRKINLAPITTDINGMVFTAEPGSRPQLLMCNYTQSGAHPQLAHLIATKDLVKNTPKIFLKEKCGKMMHNVEFLYKLYNKLYTTFVENYNTVLKLPNKAKYLKSLDLLINFDKISLDLEPLSKNETPDPKESLLAYEIFIMQLFTFKTGIGRILTQTPIPEFAFNDMAPQVLNFMWHVTPAHFAKLSKENAHYWLDRCFVLLSKNVCPSYSFVGIMSAIAMMEQLIQNTLDAPGTVGSGNSAQLSFSEICEPTVNQSKVHKITCVLTEVTEDLDMYVHVSLDKLKPKYSLCKIPPGWWVDDPNLDPKTLFIVCSIENNMIYNYSLISGEILLYNLLLHNKDTISNVQIRSTLSNVELCIAVVPRIELDSYAATSSWVKDFVSKITIKGISELLSTSITIEDHHDINTDGVMTEHKRNILTIITTDIDIIYRIPNVDVNTIMIANPSVHASRFGKLSGIISMKHSLNNAFDNHYTCHTNIEAHAPFCDKTFTPLNDRYVKLPRNIHTLQRASISAPKSTLEQAPFISEYASVSDPVGAMALGTQAFGGSSIYKCRRIIKQ